jgi:16S rRNA G966 N2-methylase RsmD
MNNQRADLTFKQNIQHGRHGWIRLTPAYSVKLVGQLLDQLPSARYVLDPFSGSGTTGLVCAQRGLACDLIDINPFLVWLAQAKSRNYTLHQLEATRTAAAQIMRFVSQMTTEAWIPPIHNIERWWSPQHLIALARLRHAITTIESSSASMDLLFVAFCRAVIQWSNAAFNHQSMSFKDDLQLRFEIDDRDTVYQTFLADVQKVTRSAAEPIAGNIGVFQGDARDVSSITSQRYDTLITSPPYPNRMSYIRELRPYMYWLGYLKEAREAGELDWQAIGGTWGIATSRLQQWTTDTPLTCIPDFESTIAEIHEHSDLLANYVQRYFVDMWSHLESVRTVMLPQSRLHYIVGNSKFYETVVPVENWFAAMMQAQGYSNIEIKNIRKRNSKKELYEFIVSCRMG